MPSPKKPKKKTPVDEKQKSLFSFVDKSEAEKEEKSISKTKEEITKPKDELKTQVTPKTEVIKEETKIKEEPRSKKVSQKTYFKSTGIPFGLKEDGIQLKNIDGE
ncbi:MAG: hypothetical protein KGD72_07985, partial [Candidatus Lokiarchaeota archaeon]|nr:hypothetical protein [Candidatus Lokiarchaeota archaeon]